MEVLLDFTHTCHCHGSAVCVCLSADTVVSCLHRKSESASISHILCVVPDTAAVEDILKTHMLFVSQTELLVPVCLCLLSC